MTEAIHNFYVKKVRSQGRGIHNFDVKKGSQPRPQFVLQSVEDVVCRHDFNCLQFERGHTQFLRENRSRSRAFYAKKVRTRKTHVAKSKSIVLFATTLRSVRDLCFKASRMSFVDMTSTVCSFTDGRGDLDLSSSFSSAVIQ